MPQIRSTRVIVAEFRVYSLWTNIRWNCQMRRFAPRQQIWTASYPPWKRSAGGRRRRIITRPKCLFRHIFYGVFTLTQAEDFYRRPPGLAILLVSSIDQAAMIDRLYRQPSHPKSQICYDFWYNSTPFTSTHHHKQLFFFFWFNLRCRALHSYPLIHGSGICR